VPACTDPPICLGTQYCCGNQCCQLGFLCCDVPGPGPAGRLTCVNPADSKGTCPIGCPLCQ
jgi:hypothetical protein